MRGRRRPAQGGARVRHHLFRGFAFNTLSSCAPVRDPTLLTSGDEPIPTSRQQRVEPSGSAAQVRPAETGASRKAMTKKKVPAKTTRAKAKATVGGPAHPGANSASDVLEQKRSGTEDLAASFPYNATKANEYGELATQGPEEGQHAAPSDPIVGASTVSESNTSDKTGKAAEPGDNPTV